MAAMKDLVSQMVSGTFRSLIRRFETKDAERGNVARVKAELEWVVEMVDPAIRGVPRYKKKLHDAIATSLEFADNVVTAIPGAIDVRRANFVSDPYVSAFFVNVHDLQTVFSCSSEIREFLDGCGSQITACYALLCMRKTEKTVFGVELEGDMLRHDVKQTAVNFSDHRIYSPSSNEAECRDGLRHCLVQGLGAHTLERIMRLKVGNHRLQQERHDLNMRLRHLGSRGDTDIAVARETDTITRKLALVEQQLLNLRQTGPEGSMREVQDVFSSPDVYMRIQKTTLLLNRMCIKVDERSEQPHNTINLTEVSIGEDSPRVVTLAKFAGEELHPAEEFMVPRYLS